MSNLISLKNIYKIYNSGETKLKALDDLNLSISHGEFVAIIGQSGSGKSTLMNILGCLDIPNDGQYILDGINIFNSNDKILSYIRNQKIGFIFQGFNLISCLSAMENVELPLVYRSQNKHLRKKLAYEALVKVGLSSRIHHKPLELSGGQQQRVAIARAIAGNPSIILADEPTGNLDSKSSHEVMSILRNLYLEGKTVIIITHDNQIADQAQRLITIQDGKIISDIKKIGYAACFQ